ncbi:helix-turn-helix domain-containing protein, partial [Gammaproteobacteria bacterium]|nr:helix-turn-helix domain-containing protein [Gammaproteobacteria bacterium]
VTNDPTHPDKCSGPCPIERGMRVLGGKWTASILWQLRDEPVRFNELSRKIDGASKKMIADRLRRLEELGLIDRHVEQQGALAVSYQLTVFGATALDCLKGLMHWSEQLPKELRNELDGHTER